MRLVKFFQVLGVITLLSLVYIYMQMEIFSLAYLGKRKEKAIVKMSEYNDMLAYNILQKKSAHFLGSQLLEKDSQLSFRDDDQVVQLVTSEVVASAASEPAVVAKNASHPILSFLSFRGQAEARADERRQPVRARRRY